MNLRSYIRGVTTDRGRRAVLLAVVTVLLLLADRGMKLLAIDRLKGAPATDIWEGFVRIVYQENPGAMLSLGAELHPSIRFLFLTLFVALLLGALLLTILLKKEVRPVDVIAAALVLAGGGGNVIDRLLYDGVVIDYVTIGWDWLRTGVFNLADVAILAGAFLFIFGRRESKG